MVDVCTNCVAIWTAVLLLISVLYWVFSRTKGSSNSNDQSWRSAKSVYEFKVKDIDGRTVALEKYRGHPLIIVNVACKCGFTNSNYKQLEKIYKKYKDSSGLRILGFPCNQFAKQEPGTSEEIKAFIQRFNIQFDMFSKISVNGENADPLFKYLKHKQKGLFFNAIK